MEDGVVQEAKKNPIRRYTCTKHGSIEVGGGGVFTTLSMHLKGSPETSNPGEMYGEFLYCMLCFGEWAEKQFPMTCKLVEEPNDKPADQG